MPIPLRTSQTSGHFSSRVSNLTLRSLKPPSSHGSKIIIFHLSQSKCTVSALFLHGFKGCNGYSDLQNTTKGAETQSSKPAMHRREMTLKRNFQKLRESPGVRYESVGRGVESPRAHQNPTKNRKIPRGFSFSGALHTFAHFLHTGGKAVFFPALSAFCAS